MDKKKRFIKTEKWLFRGYLIWVAIALFLDNNGRIDWE